MKRLTPILIGGSLAFGAGPAGSAAQQEQTSAELALESLLSIPVSTASKYEQKQTDAPLFVPIITREEIRSLGNRTLEEVLSNQAGFYAGTDRQYSDVGFRGLGRSGYYNNKLCVLLGGHTVNDNSSGGARVSNAMSMDLENVERIELVRGPGSARYGVVFGPDSDLTPELSITLGLRWDEYSTRGSATTPRGAVVFHASESSTLKLLAVQW